MKQLNGYRIRLVLVGLVAAIVIGGGSANADFTFGIPTNLGPTVNSAYQELNLCISFDGLSLYFASDRPGGFGGRDIWATTRPTTEDEWGEPKNLGPLVNSSAFDSSPSISADGSTLYFSSDRPGGYGTFDLWVATRETKDDPWAEPMNLGPTVNSSAYDGGPGVSADGLELYFFSERPGGSGISDLWVITRATTDDNWGTPVNLGPTVNGPTSDSHPSISADGLCLFFSDRVTGPYRKGGFGGADIWMTIRPMTDEPWGPTENLGPIINSHDDRSPSISADGSTLYFHSNAREGFGDRDLYQAPIIPIVDLNGDGIVDAAEMRIMVDHWDENYTLCDIGPTPLGDGIVDVQDLVVLSEHLFEEVNDPTLVAHWALDETKGAIASESANDNDGTVYGDPAWQPEGGMVDGALQLDGIDDYVNTTFVLNPADGKFSVFAWIKGGAPGQVVLSQADGANWLCTDSVGGNLMTELMGTGRDATELLSQTNITDGNWHRIALVWDGSNRTLYVDEVAVAEDTQTNLEGSENSLYIGTGTAMEPGSFWSGLIDDVRIYNRAVRP